MYLLFVLLKKKTNSKGKAPLYCRITVNGRRAEFSTGIHISSEHWKASKQYVEGSPSDVYFNSILTTYRMKAETLHLEAFKANTWVSAEQIKKAITSKQEVITFSILINKFTQYLATPEADVTHGTIRTYRTRLRNVYDFLKEIALLHSFPGDIDKGLLKSMQAWHKQKGHSLNYCMKNIRALDTMLNYAVDKDFLKINPLQGFRYKSEPSKPTIFLTPGELSELVNYNFKSERLQRIAHLFVFQCYTGLSYIDLCRTQPDTLQEHYGKKWIILPRQKTGQYSYFPLLPEAAAIWEYYQGELPILSNDKYNEYVKEVVFLAGIDKHVTTRTARKTFSDIMKNRYGVHFEILAAMLGHSSTRITQAVYARVDMYSINKAIFGEAA